VTVVARTLDPRELLAPERIAAAQASGSQLTK